MTRHARWLPRAIGLCLLFAITLFGAVKLSFLCDDAFITFRHVSNAVDGHGLVWNAPPFRPVEGYTSFSWAMLLWLFWSWFGVEPPAAANVLSIGLGLATFGCVCVAAFRVRRADGTRVPDVAVFVALAVLASNRCFLQWMTSGLETALFNLCFVGWVLLAFQPEAQRGKWWWPSWSLAAALTALTRPDGLLLVAATAAAAVFAVLQRRHAWRSVLLGCLPLLTVGMHVLWRRWFYGEWLPNTYYAKVTAPWPEAGLRYLYCFAFEQGLWLWALIAGTCAVLTIVRRQLSMSHLWTRHLPALAAVTATIVHVGYYVLRVGGDHFEYRIFSYLVPLIVLSALLMLARLSSRAVLTTGGLVALGVASCFGWLHFALNRAVIPPDHDVISDKLPSWLRPLTREFDRNQVWLQLQYNCARCNAHQRSLATIAGGLPARSRSEPDALDVPVTMAMSVGVVGWVMPDVAVIDLLGLCDWVGARAQTSSWIPTFLPREVLQAVLASADSDHDDRFERRELEAQFAAALACPPENAAGLVKILLLLFAHRDDESLTRDEAAAIEPFFAQMRFMAHERHAPPDYVQALDPNVTVEARKLVVRRRDVPLTADRVRAIETEWRQRITERRQ